MERRQVHDSSKNPTSHLCYLFVEQVMWKDPTLQPVKLRCSWRYIGRRLGIVVARTIRRLPTAEREESRLEVAMRGTPVAGRPADAAAGDAHTVTRHAVEQREVIVIVVLASSAAPLQGAAAKASAHLPIQFQTCPSRQSRGHNHHQHPSGGRVDSSGLGGDVPMKVSQSVEPTKKSHAPVEELDESLAPKRQRGRPATHCSPSSGSTKYTAACPGCDGNSYRHLLKCQQKRVKLGFSASSGSREVLGDVVMGEVPIPEEEVLPPFPPAEPPPLMKTSSETDAMMLAGIHQYGHEEPLEISRTEFESIVKDGFYFEEDTLEDLPN